MTSLSNCFTSCHILDDKSTAQTKVQIQIVEQLEQQLNKEQRRLEAMMNHLKHIKEEEMIVQKISDNSPQVSSQSSQQLPQLSPLPFLSYSPSQKMSSQVGPVRRKVTERQSSMEGMLFRFSLLISTYPLLKSGSPDAYQRCYMADKGSTLDVESEMNQNRDFYRIQDMRPPFTYAALIRQVF